MKKTLLLLFSLALCLAACQNAEELTGEINNNTPKFTLKAVIDNGDDDADATRTIVGNDGYTKWEAGDEITVMKENEAGVKSFKFTASELSQEDKMATFTTTQDFQTDSKPSSYYFAGYPNGIYTAGDLFPITLTCKLDSVQTYDAENMVASKCNPAVAAEAKAEFEANPLFHFKNLCGLLRLKFKGNATIKAIRFITSGTQYVSGTCSFDPLFQTTPTMTAGDTIVKLDCGTGVALDATTDSIFYIVLPPTTYNGFTIEVEDVNGAKKQYKSTKNHAITRSQIHTIASLTFISKGVWYNIDNKGWVFWGTSTTLPSTAATSSFALKTDEGFTFSAAQMAAVNTYVKTSKTNGSIAVAMDQAEYVTNAIPKDAFNLNTKIKTFALPKNVEKIGEQAFYKCGYMTALSSTKVINELGKNTFVACGNLKTIPDVSGITKIPYGCFEDCRVMTYTTCITANVDTIGDRAFLRCHKMTVDNLSSTSVTTLGVETFELCNGLLTLPQFPNVEEYPKYCFASCPNMKTVVIPEGCKKIWEYSVSSLTAMTSIVIPSTMEYMEKTSVGNCPMLGDITSNAVNAPTFIIDGSGYSPFQQANGVIAGKDVSGIKYIHIPKNSTGYTKTTDNWYKEMISQHGWTYSEPAE